MNIKDSESYHEIVDLILKRSNANDTTFKYNLEFILEDGTVVTVYRVHQPHIVRDFAKRYSDYVTVIVTMNRLAYKEYIYLNREDLKCRLTMIACDPKTGKESTNKVTAEYTVKLLNHTDEAMRSGNSVGVTSRADEMEMIDIPLQLLPAKLETYRFIRVSGTIRATTREDLLLGVMSNFGEYPVNLHKPDNIEPCKQIILDVTQNLSQFPYWLQKHGGGVYKNDLGWYMYNGWVYIYPIYDTRHNDDREVVSICVVGPGQLDGIDATYATNGGKIRILSTGFIESEDTTESGEYNHGNGVEFNEPNLVSDGVAVDDAGKVKLTGSKLRQHHIDERKLNNVVTKSAITANVHYEASRLARNRGMVAHLNWSNANPTLIKPNSEVTLMYDTGGIIHTRRGVILGAEFINKEREGNDANTTHTIDAVIHVYLDKDAK